MSRYRFPLDVHGAGHFQLKKFRLFFGGEGKDLFFLVFLHASSGKPRDCARLDADNSAQSGKDDENELCL